MRELLPEVGTRNSKSKSWSAPQTYGTRGAHLHGRTGFRESPTSGVCRMRRQSTFVDDKPQAVKWQEPEYRDLECMESSAWVEITVIILGILAVWFFGYLLLFRV